MRAMTGEFSRLRIGIVLVSAGIALSTLLYYAVMDGDDSNIEPAPAAVAVYPHKRTIRYSFTVQNKTNEYLEAAEFRTYAPVLQTSSQQASTITASHEFAADADELGNQQLVFRFSLAPLATRIVTITAEVDLAQQPNQLALSDAQDYLRPSKYIESDDYNVIALAEQFGDVEAQPWLRSAFNWVADNIEYAGYIEDDRGALYALDHRRGDCTEYMYLFAALARSRQIPTRGVGGFVVSEDAILKAREFHNWAEVYIDGRWRVVDPQNKQFMQQEDHYLALRILADRDVSEDSATENTHRIAYVGEGLSVHMN
jgi:transglutaminase-like putative cysteine protease